MLQKIRKKIEQRKSQSVIGDLKNWTIMEVDNWTIMEVDF